jgi:hypothetical protein
VTTTTIDAAADTRPATAATRGKTDVWAEFYAQVNSYDEPSRPSVADVLAVRNTLSASLDSGVGQHSWDSLTLPDGKASWAGKSTMGGAYARTFRLELSPGTIRVGSKDFDQQGITEEEASQAARKAVDMAIVAGEYVVDDGPSTSEIREWSPRSRSNMHQTLASLDYSDWARTDGALAMVTVTYPDNWKPLVPNGKAFKRHTEMLRRRWARAIGPWRLLWKMEFQKRGAPHWHALMRVPAMVTTDGGYGPKLGYQVAETFEDWLARTWAGIVGASTDVDRIGVWKPVGETPVMDLDGKPLFHPSGAPVMTAAAWEIVGSKESSEYSRHLEAGIAVDFSGKDFSDPRRIAMYFAGHSSKHTDGKEYQHIVPAKWRSPGNGPGRFWGFSGLERATAVLELTQRDYDRVRRELRKLARARSWEIAVKRQHGREFRAGVSKANFSSPARIDAPKLRRSQLGGGGGQNGGWVLLNDALQVARQLGSFLSEEPCSLGCGCGNTPPEYSEGVVRAWGSPVLV